MLMTLYPRRAQRHSEKDQASLKCAYQIASRFLARFDADNLNKLKNLASKIIGEKMKVGILLIIFSIVRFRGGIL
jgi:hypothetical protein